MPKFVKVIAAVVIGIVAFVYGVSPVDLIADPIFPVGLFDDAAVWIAAITAIVKLLKGRNTGGATPPVAP